ncbi:tetratricopeptide repeat-containing glycosyltransferase family protein [Magnetospirillum sp. SS-4]|uniref:tetratricopeptide repeat-containing glycosyltransferase family protein n=1 Tax=Magnetospirillum sp. SS-4 TaxID=2681465 RepID=UPI00137FAE30|nr:tetratricopeptide repeat-containing glycosyltransferase family protein [Magnetospirillum sp. SS-4]CAA7623110.1 TPR repeat-containing protein [Magnetospirillum sp. SS-4]
MMTAAASEAEAQRAFAAGGEAWRGGRIEAAAQAFARAAQLRPGWATAHANLGAALRRLGKSEAAVASYRRALALEPDQAATLSNLGNALRDLGRLDEAAAALRRAVELDPGSIGFLYNLALLLRDQRRHHEAAGLLERVLASDPANAEYQWDLALSRLYLGDYRRGFAGYEARLGLARNPRRDVPGQRWTGAESVAGRTVLLTSEQGFGDALQFARYVPLLAGLGAAVVLECQPELADLFASLPGVVALVSKGAPPPPYDLWLPMASLPHVMGTTFETIPAAVPYLTPPPRPDLSVPRPPGTVLSVGLVWAGKTTPRDRSWPLEDLLPLFTDARVAIYSLQLGPRAADLARLGVDRLLIDAAPALASFADTAAVMARLDLIVTIDTATAHLAGALGRPVWVLLRHVSDWRWQDDPATSPWYPTMRLFRQPDPLDFKTSVAEAARALRTLLPP